jgi:hypothetical protein
MPLIDASNLVLISLHIPKTAGTSFRNILVKVYGEKAVVRFDMINEKIYINEQLFSGTELPSYIKVIHGHFVYSELTEQIKLPHHVKHVTWLRHPVSRVISNYFYLAEMMNYYMQEEVHHIDIISKMQRTLTEYAADEKNRNRISKFLAGISLSDFDFVGLVEYFEEHLYQMSEKLGWPKQIAPVHYNATGRIKKGDGVDEELKTKIARWNDLDMILYKTACDLNK